MIFQCCGTLSFAETCLSKRGHCWSFNFILASYTIETNVQDDAWNIYFPACIQNFKGSQIRGIQFFVPLSKLYRFTIIAYPYQEKYSWFTTNYNNCRERKMAWRRSGKLFHLVHFCETALMYLIATHRKNVKLYKMFVTYILNLQLGIILISLSLVFFFFFLILTETYFKIIQRG